MNFCAYHLQSYPLGACCPYCGQIQSVTTSTFPTGPILSVSSQAAREPSPDPRAMTGAQPTSHDGEQVGPRGNIEIYCPRCGVELHPGEWCACASEEEIARIEAIVRGPNQQHSLTDYTSPSATAQIPVDGHMPGPGGMYAVGFMDAMDAW